MIRAFSFPELLEYASSKLNYFNLINTNGSLIGDQLLKPRYKRFLLNMDVIIVSLDSLTVPQLSGMYKVSDNISRKVLRNILALKILQNYVPFKLVANTTITHDTIEESFDILDFCCDLGITFSPVSANIGHNPDYELLKKPRYQELVKKIIERGKEKFSSNFISVHGFEKQRGWDGFLFEDQIIYKFEQVGSVIALKYI